MVSDNDADEDYVDGGAVMLSDDDWRGRGAKEHDQKEKKQRKIKEAAHITRRAIWQGRPGCQRRQR